MAGQDLVISVGANIAALERQMKAAAQVAEKRADEIEGEFKKRNPSFAGDFGLGLLKGAIAGLAVDKLAKAFFEVNKEVANLAETAKRAGVDLARFQELRLAASREGIETKTFDSGIEGLAQKLNEARQKENDLTGLLDENNVKYKDRKGEVISTNEALAVAADLIARAATEQDKVKIADAFGLPKDFIPLLEGGAASLQRLAQEARDAGGVLDADVVAKAKEFDTAWNNAWASFAANAKSGILSAAQGLAELIAAAQKFAATVPVFKADNLFGFDPITDDGESRRGRGFGGIREPAADNPLTVNVRKTKTSSLFGGAKGGGGSGGGKSEEEQAQDRLDRYIESLVRQRAVMEAEIATVGKSNAERKAAVEIAKAQVDLEKLSASEKANYIAKLTQEVSKNEEVRASKERLYQAQKDLNEAQKYFGNAAVDALEDLIINGAKAEDVMKRLVASLAKAALQAALLGEGPLAGLFGTKGASGSIGGLFGLLFGGGVKAATGGYISGPGTGRSDSIPARLSNGEYVINARATKQNRALLDAINSGKVPAFADGGLVGRAPSIPAMSRASGGTQIVVNNTVSDQVQATPQRSNDGSIQIMIEAIKGDIANDLVHGKGAVGTAMKAVGSGRQLRG